MINLHERMLPTSAGVEPATSWSPVERRIQLSHQGRLALASAQSDQRLPCLITESLKTELRFYNPVNPLGSCRAWSLYLTALLLDRPSPLTSTCEHSFLILIVLGFNDMSTLEGHFVSSPREREKRDRRESRGDEREGQGRKRNRNESEETEEIKTFPLYPYPLQG